MGRGALISQASHCSAPATARLQASGGAKDVLGHVARAFSLHLIRGYIVLFTSPALGASVALWDATVSRLQTKVGAFSWKI